MTSDGNPVVTLTGELDVATADRAYAGIRDLIDQWGAPVSVDLAGLTFCDAAGLRSLTRAASYAQQAQRPLQLRSIPRPLLRIMRITGCRIEVG